MSQVVLFCVLGYSCEGGNMRLDLSARLGVEAPRLSALSPNLADFVQTRPAFQLCWICCVFNFHSLNMFRD